MNIATLQNNSIQNSYNTKKNVSTPNNYTNLKFGRNLLKDAFFKSSVKSRAHNPYDILSSIKNAIDDCVNNIKNDNPIEVAYLCSTKKNNVYSKFTGNNNSARINLFKVPLFVKPVLYHGHPQQIEGSTKYTLPVSFEDFKLLNKSRVKKIVALNVNKEESYLLKTKHFKPLSKEDFSLAETEYIKAIAQTADHATAEKLEGLYSYIKKHPNNSNIVKAQVLKIIEELQFSKNGAKQIDIFWKEHAKQYNLNYINNFSE